MNRKKIYNSISYRCLHSDQGLSLFELLIAIAIISILSISLMAVFFSFQKGNTLQQVNLDVVQKARSAIEYMSSEIKMAGFDPFETGDFRDITAEAFRFRYHFDTPATVKGVDFDGIRNNSATRPERRTFRFSSNKLEQVDNEGENNSSTLELLLDINMNSGDPASSNSRFEYIDKTGATIAMSGSPLAVPDANLSDIAGVIIHLSVRSSAGISGSLDRSFEPRIICRNLQFNAQR